MPNAHELVARGAALLDEKLPGWADQIDLESLEMASGCDCVLGQLGERGCVNLDESWHNPHYSVYVHVADVLGIERADSGGGRYWGFDNGLGVAFADLQDAWKGAIVDRRTLDAR